MAATASVKVIKEFTYRGAVRQFSNRYHIGTAYPPDSTHWTTLCDAITAAEKLVNFSFSQNGARIVEAIGYAPGSEVPVFSKVYSLDGLLSGSGSQVTPGDVAALVRYSTPDRSTKNHPVYCFNFYHAVSSTVGAGTQDTFLASQRSAFQTYAAAWISGFSDGTTTYKRSRPTGDLCTGYSVSATLTHRDLPH
jgi:hypothetical protein